MLSFNEMGPPMTEGNSSANNMKMSIRHSGTSLFTYPMNIKRTIAALITDPLLAGFSIPNMEKP